MLSIFTEKVKHVEGALDFLLAAGFREIKLDGEDYLIWSAENIEEGHNLPELLEALKNCECISLELDRNIQVLLPSQAKRVELPSDFYHITPEELKREQQLQREALENAQVLKTKAMREREEQRALRIYRYALIRIKFPNGIYIQVLLWISISFNNRRIIWTAFNSKTNWLVFRIVQGTFDVHEKLSDIYEFVQSCLSDENLNFDLIDLARGGGLSEDEFNKTILELR